MIALTEKFGKAKTLKVYFCNNWVSEEAIVLGFFNNVNFVLENLQMLFQRLSDWRKTFG